MASFTLIAVHILSEGHGSWSQTASQSAMFSFGRFVDTDTNVANYMISEMFLFVILGCLGGVLGAMFNEINIRTTRRRLGSTPAINFSRIIGISIAMSFVAYFFSYWFGTCQSIPQKKPTWSKQQVQLASELVQFYCPKGEYNDLASLYLTQPEIAIKQVRRHACFHGT